MSPQCFIGNNSKEAIQSARETLGEDAAVLSNRSLADGRIEIVAVSASYIASLSGRAAAQTQTQPADPTPKRTMIEVASPSGPVATSGIHPSWSAPQADRQSTGLSDLRPRNHDHVNKHQDMYTDRATAHPLEIQQRFQQVSSGQVGGHGASSSSHTPRVAPHTNPASVNRQPMRSPLATNAPAISDASSSAEIAKEVKALRDIMEGQLAAMAWDNMKRNDPGKMAVIKAMLNAGFSSLLARTLSRYTQVGANPERALSWLQAGLTKHVLMMGGEPIDSGGVFALVGPTGVGKTTTTAKIAARCAMRHGPRSFALITTDSYRVAAEEQLAGYGKILGCPVYTVRSSEDLRGTIDELAGKRVILIDTVGMSQRDQRVADQIAMLAGTGTVKKLLVLNCSSSGAVLDEVASSYSSDAGAGGLSGVILSKSDESAQIGPALDVAIRRKLPIAYMTTGQRVPEDIIVPSPAALIRQAFSVSDNPFSITDFEIQPHVVGA